MVVFPNCKINFGLHILGKRSDGFHDIETVFCAINLKDALEIISNSNQNSDVDFSASGLEVDGAVTNNICVKAYNLLKNDFPNLPTIKMHLHKAIPMGAGLGGGSADGAFVLQMLNKKFGLQLSQQTLISYAKQLGSDCSFFIINTPCHATGRGEILTPISIILKEFKILLVNPNIHINTGWAFSQCTSLVKHQKTIAEIITQPIVTWRNTLINDFEQPIFKKHTALAAIKETLYNNGAVYAAMSGSGSTLFGLFEKAIPKSIFDGANYYVKEVAFL